MKFKTAIKQFFCRHKKTSYLPDKDGDISCWRVCDNCGATFGLPPIDNEIPMPKVKAPRKDHDKQRANGKQPIRPSF